MPKKVVLSFFAVVLLILAGMIIASKGQARERGRRAGASSFDNKPLARSDTEKKILSVLEEMGNDPSERYLSVSQSDGRLMRLLTEAVGAKRVIEIGTSTGYSGLWFALALRATGGKW